MNKTLWRDIFKQTWLGIQNDHLGIIASGIAFYCFLGIFPFLTVSIGLYRSFLGFLPVKITSFLNLLPPMISELLHKQLQQMSGEALYLSISTLLSILISFWTASLALKNLMEGFDIAYRVPKHRSLQASSLQAFLMTVVMSGLFFFLLLAASFLPVVLKMLAIDRLGQITILTIDLTLVLLGLSLVINFLYYKIPNHQQKTKFFDHQLGAWVATLFIALSSYLFASYIQYITNYNAIYGALSGVVIFLLWLRLIILMVLVGAKLNYRRLRNSEID